MKSLHKSQGLLLVTLIGLALSGLILSGCQTMGQRDMGKYVAPGSRVALDKGEPHSQTFKTVDMTVTYQYKTAGNRLKVWGRGDIRYESINELTFHLFFLDAQSKVISCHDFYSHLDHSDFTVIKANTRQFHRDFTIPAGAQAFAIGYDGETMHSADQADINFSHTPFD
jgi:hypothetical protein